MAAFTSARNAACSAGAICAIVPRRVCAFCAQSPTRACHSERGNTSAATSGETTSASTHTANAFFFHSFFMFDLSSS